MIGVVIFTSMIVLMMLGVPIVFSIGLSAIVGLLYSSSHIPLIFVPSSMFNGMDSFPLMAVPFFVLAGELMNAGGISRRLIDFALATVGHLRGGLGQATVVSNAIMSSVSGSALAQVAAIGRIMIPAMERQGYPRDLATAISCSASLLGPIIPPSIIMVIYGVTAGASIGALFLAGITPGILLALSMMAYVYVVAWRLKIPTLSRFSLCAFLIAGKNAIFALIMPIVILGGIFGGIMTPTEAGAVAVCYALLAGVLIYRELTWRKIWSAFITTGLITSAIMLIVGTARVVSDLMAADQVPQEITRLVLAITREPLLLLVLINVLLLIAGALMDESAAILLLTPVLLPVAIAAGIDPMVFGIVMCLNMVIGLAAPPVGIALFLASDIGKVPFERLALRILPLLGVQVANLFLVTYLPQIALWLPRLAGY
jgi:tripartite ATP-independent transporter DctM subunit